MTVRKPTVLKLLEGNPGKRPLTGDEVKPQPIAMGCPKWLPGEAKIVWKEYAEKLERLCLLTEIDGADFQNFCIALGDVNKLTVFIDKNGHTFNSPTGNITRRPEVEFRNQAIKIVTVLAGKFGMSPSDRAGLVTVDGKRTKSKMNALMSK